jgi:deazaflavin-dependent oxidoreductase (nitroreductase family)
VYSLSRGRIGLKGAADGQTGVLRLKTTGRRSGDERRAMLGYLQDGANMVLVAMNGWRDPEPGWLLNLIALPRARVDVVGGERQVAARIAQPQERARLWARLNGPSGSLDRYAQLRSRETAIVILEPRRTD